MSETLSALRCPNCSAPDLVDVGNGTVQCQYCNSGFAHPERVCPRCQAVSGPDELDCPVCGHALRGLCPSCNTPNPLQAKVCRRCGTSLDLLASVAGRVATTSADLIYERSASASAIKQREEQASRERLARMWERDQERERRLGESLAKRGRQEKTLATLAAALLILLVIGGLLLFILTQIK